MDYHRRNRVSAAKNAEELYKIALEKVEVRNPDFFGIFNLLKESADLGNGDAYYAMATWYLFGKDPVVRKNLKKAIEYLKIASDKGVSSAMYDLAVSYEKGIGVRISLPKAFEKYLSAALAGDSQAYYEVARMYYYGIGVQKNRSIAKLWFEKAKELGVEE